MHPKRGKARDAQAGGKPGKPPKPPGFRTGRPPGETFAAARPRWAATQAARHA